MVATVAARCVIGVDVGGTKLLAGVVDDGLAVHHRAQRASRPLNTAELLDRLEAMVVEARDAAEGEIAGVGFGVPGVIDRRQGVISAAPNLPLAGVRFQALLSERLGLPVAIDNDANCAMLAEWRHGAARGATDALMLTLGTGIGGGIVCNGGIVRGASGGAAEIGHMVLDLQGPPCAPDCPGHGHFEWYASGAAIGRAGQRAAVEQPRSALGREAAAGREITGALVTELAHDGDEVARAVLAEQGRLLGFGLATLVNVFNPEVIVIGGGAIGAGDLLLDPAREVVATEALPGLRDVVRIIQPRFGAEAGMLGAATLAFEEIVR
jgi:glucokinase